MEPKLGIDLMDKSILTDDDFEGINFSRSKTHRIIDISKHLDQRSFTRQCTFNYSENKEKKRTYEKKETTIKIKKYLSLSQAYKEGHSIGEIEFNLRDYLEKGLIMKTFKMDKKAELYLTVKILLSNADDSKLGIS